MSLFLQIYNLIILVFLVDTIQFLSKPPNSKPSLILPIPFPEAKFHGIPVNSKTNQWQIRSRIQTLSVFGSSPSITTWLRRPTALISLTVPSKVLSTFTLKRRRLS